MYFFRQPMNIVRALEKYLESHVSKYIESIGNNNWLSMFEVKLLPEVSEMLD